MVASEADAARMVEVDAKGDGEDGDGTLAAAFETFDWACGADGGVPTEVPMGGVKENGVGLDIAPKPPKPANLGGVCIQSVRKAHRVRSVPRTSPAPAASLAKANGVGVDLGELAGLPDIPRLGIPFILQRRSCRLMHSSLIQKVLARTVWTRAPLRLLF